MAFEFNNPLLQELRGGNSDSPFIDKHDLCVISNESKISLDELPSEFHGTTITLIGTAQAGANTTITLTSSASATNDRYNTFTISITGGTGSGQSKTITDYVGSTKIAIVDSSWAINPDATSIYSIACYNESKTNIGLSINSFYVNYLNSIITFNSSEIGQTVLVSYKGRGIIRTPAERIYCVDSNGNPVSSFQDIAVNLVDEAVRKANEEQRISNENVRILSEQSKNVAEVSRESAESLRIANAITHNNNENIRISQELARVNAEGDVTKGRVKAENDRNSAEIVRSTAYNSSVLIWQTPVANFAALASTYPSALVGWCAQTLDNNQWYRYSGTAWEYKGNFSITGAATVVSLNDIDKAKADIVRDQMHSGVTSLSSLTTGSTTTLNGFTVKAFKSNINGYQISIPDTVVTLEAPPTTGTRDDLVFLEAYFPSGGNGYTLSWRIRTVSNVNFNVFSLDGFTQDTNLTGAFTYNNAVVAPQGGNSVPLDALGLGAVSYVRFGNYKQRGNIGNIGYIATISPNDVGIYIAGIGDSASKTALQTYDGYSYAIPLFRVKRRNSSGFSPSNPNGARGYAELATLSSTISGINQGFYYTFTVNNTNNLGVGMIIAYHGDLSYLVFVQSIIDSTRFIGLVIKSTANASFTVAYKFYSASDHPQSLYSNVIDSRDIADLRHETKAQYNYDYMLKKADDMFKRGELSAKKLLATHHGIPKTEIDVNTVFYASLDGTTVAEVGGSPASGVVSTDIKAWKPSWTGSGVQFNNKFTYPVVTTFINGLTIDFTVDLTELRAIGTTRILGGYLDGTYKFNVYFDSNDKMWISLPGATPQFVLVSGYSGKVKIRHAITNTVYNGSVNGKVLTTISNIGVSVSTISIDTVHLGSYGDGSSVTPCKATLSDVSISNIDRGSLFPNLPADFISGDAQIMPAYTVQRRILSQSQTTQTVNSIVKATNLNNSRGINRIVIGTPNTWSAGDTVTVTGMAGELIAGVFDTDTAKSTLVKDALSTDTSAYFDIVDATLYSDGDTIKLVDRVLGTLLATKIINTGGVDAVNKKLTFTETIGVALSKYQVVAMESTATSSNPKVYYMNGTTKTEVTGDAVTPWTGVFGNVATFKLGTNASLVAQDIQIDYSLIMPAGQPALSVPTTTTLMGEAGFRLPYANQTIVSDYASKVSGRTWENPNIAKTLSAIVANNPAPSTFVDELITSEYAKMFVQDGTVTTFSTSVNGEQACILLGFDLIKIAERKLGCKIPRKTVADKVAWLKAGNITSITANILCNGSSPMGSKETLATWNLTTWSGFTPITSTSSSIVTLTKIVTVFTTFIDVNGFVHYTVYSDPSDGVTPSTINVDYASLDLKFQDKIVNSFGLATGQTVDVRDDFVGKVSGSVVENPNIFKTTGGTFGTALQSPSSLNFSEMSQGSYDNSKSLNGVLTTHSIIFDGAIMQQLFSFNLIRIVEDKYGPIPAIDKVQWLKDNLSNVTCNWWGYGSSPIGNNAILRVWKTSQTQWDISSSNLTGIVTKTTVVLSASGYSITDRITADGFLHFLAYADASDGVTASTIYTDYCNIELIFKKPTGYDVLSPSNPRRDAGLSTILFVRKETKEVQSLFPYSNEFMLTTYNEYLEAPTPISANTDVTILAEIPEFLITDLGSAVGNKQGTHPWMNLAYRVGQDNDNLYGELGFSSVPFAPDSVGVNVGSKIRVDGMGFNTNFTTQISLKGMLKPIIFIYRALALVNGELKLIIFSNYSTTGATSITTSFGRCLYVLSISGKPLSKELDGIVRSYLVPTAWQTNPLVVQGFVDKVTNKLITTNNSI